MKKTLLLAAAFIVASASFAQENLAIGGTAKATAEKTQDNNLAGMAIDDNVGTRWEAPQDHFANGEDVEWTLELKDKTTFNTIQILWEGAYSKSFVISVSDDNTAYTDVYTETEKTLAGFPSLQTYELGKDVTAKYIKFKNVARGTQWGVSFFEFRVFKMDKAALTSIALSSSATMVKVGTSVDLTAIGKDQIGNTMDISDFTFVVTPNDAGTIDNGKFTPSKEGVATIKAKSGEVESNEITVTAHNGDKIDISTSMVQTTGEGTNENPGVDVMAKAFDDDLGSLWKLHAGYGDNGTKDYETGFVVDLQAMYDIKAVSIMFEGACPADYAVSFSADGKNYTTAHDIKEHAGMATFTDLFFTDTKAVRFVKFLSTKAATTFGVKIFDFSVYGDNKQELTDNEAPKDFTATVNADAATMSSVTLNLKATDNVSSVITYEISYNKADEDATVVTTSGASGTEIAYVLGGLDGNTTYNISVIAKDAKENKATAISLTATTKPMPAAAPAPTEAEEDVKSVYSDKYGNAEGIDLNPDWGQKTVNTEISLADNDNARLMTNMDYQGIAFTQMDVKKMDYLHIDIYPETATSIVVTPIWLNVSGGNYKEIPYTVTLKAGEWNQINIDLSNYASEDRGETNIVHQIKLDGGNGNTYIIDNIYFAKNSVEDTEAPTWAEEDAAVVTDVKAKSAVVTVKANDNNATGILTYTVTDAESNEVATAKGNVNEATAIEITGLTPETAYTFTISVEDKKGNKAAETKTVNFVTTENITVKPGIKNGVVAIEGEVKSAEAISKLFNDVNETAYDITKLTIPSDVKSFTVANPNAMIIVTDAQATQLSEMKNLFQPDNAYFITRGRYYITDGYPVYTKFFISLKQGYTYTREIAAGKYVTTTLPTVCTLPEGISAYTFDSKSSEGNTYTFKKADKNLAAHTPYILYSDKGATLKVEADGVIDLTMTPTVSVNNSCADITFHGNYETFVGDGSQYGLLNSTDESSIVLKPVNGGTIGAFRGYFTINNNSEAKNIRFVFNDGDTTGINAVNGEAAAKAGNVYTIDGRFVNGNGSVEGLAKGLYIVGGKKVIVK